MSVVSELFSVTKELCELLEQPARKEKRDETIEAIQRLLSQRDVLIQQLQPPYSEEEQELGMQMVSLNQSIAENLQQLKLQIQQDLKIIKQKKTANQNYRNPYQPLSIDGMFYDKKR
ncbi:MAG TPA: flagellar protein FliT [Anoxybacillus sp.]|nr:flagellar protein FliT [Anoxybacillus sp.]